MRERKMTTDFTGSRLAARRQSPLRVYAGILMLTGLSPALADNWEPMTGADTLHELVAGATAEIALTPEVTAVGKYNARDIQRGERSGKPPVGRGR